MAGTAAAASSSLTPTVEQTMVSDVVHVGLYNG